jgi:hypothetical protein
MRSPRGVLTSVIPGEQLYSAGLSVSPETAFKAAFFDKQVDTVLERFEFMVL